jgi:hypothetical protein
MNVIFTGQHNLKINKFIRQITTKKRGELIKS